MLWVDPPFTLNFPVSAFVYEYRDFRGKIPDGINPLRNSEPLIYVPSANGPDPRTQLTSTAVH